MPGDCGVALPDSCKQKKSPRLNLHCQNAAQDDTNDPRGTENSQKTTGACGITLEKDIWCLHFFPILARYRLTLATLARY